MCQSAGVEIMGVTCVGGEIVVASYWRPRRELLCCVNRISKTDLRASHTVNGSSKAHSSSQILIILSSFLNQCIL